MLGCSPRLRQCGLEATLTHFDTAHQLILGWSEETIGDDMAALKAAIRATLPTEATLED
jgi:hypothetical protein